MNPRFKTLRQGLIVFLALSLILLIAGISLSTDNGIAMFLTLTGLFGGVVSTINLAYPISAIGFANRKRAVLVLALSLILLIAGISLSTDNGIAVFLTLTGLFGGVVSTINFAYPISAIGFTNRKRGALALAFFAILFTAGISQFVNTEGDQVENVTSSGSPANEKPKAKSDNGFPPTASPTATIGPTLMDTATPTIAPMPRLTTTPPTAAIRPTPMDTATPTIAPTPTLPTIPATVTHTPTPSTYQTAAEVVEHVRDAVVSVTAGYLGGGSGFIFAVEGTTAFVVTSYHVIEWDPREIDVKVWDSKTYAATLLGYDADNDVAVVAICCDSNFTPIEREFDPPAPGAKVVAVGYPRSASRAVISTTGQIVSNEVDASEAVGDAILVWHDAPLNPGNSGGPLLSMRGGWWGVNTIGYEGLFGALHHETLSERMILWKEKLVVGPVDTPSADESEHDENVVMWIIVSNRRFFDELRLDAYIDTEVNVEEYALVVFIDGQEWHNPNRMYGDEGRYQLSASSIQQGTTIHTSVGSVSIQSEQGDLRCRKSDSRSTAEETVFECIWR